MMNFLDLSAASEDERRLIQEILSDTSVVNIVEPPQQQHHHHQRYQPQQQQQQLHHHNHHQQPQQQQTSTLANSQSNSIKPESAIREINHTYIGKNANILNSNNHSRVMRQMPMNVYNHHQTHSHHHRVQPVMQTAKLDHKNGVRIKNQTYHSPHYSSASVPQQPSAAGGGQQVPPQQAQMPPMAGDMNSVIGMTMTNSRPSGYPMPPTHVTAFGPPPTHVYGGPPLFQHYPPHYIIPYNIPAPYVPYVLPTNSVVPPRISPNQSNQSQSGASVTSSQPRPHSSHIAQQEQQQQHHHQQQQYQHQQHQQQHHHHQQQHQQQSQQQAQQHRSSRNHEQYNNVVQSQNINNAQDESGNERPPEELPVQGLEIKDSTSSATNGDGQAHFSLVDKSTKINTSPKSSETSLKSNETSHKQPEANNDKLAEPRNKPIEESFDKTKAIPPTITIKTAITNSTPGESSTSSSWAGLFRKEGSNHVQDSANDGEVESHTSESESDKDIKNKARKLLSLNPDTNSAPKTSETNAAREIKSQDPSKRANDKNALRLAQKVNSINLKHSLPFLKPRGFINKGNGCYINATLQALIACPPFYNLMKEIGDIKAYRRDNSCTPILDSFAKLFLNFPPLDAPKKNKQANSQDYKMSINHLQAESIEPKCIYNVLGQIKSECLKGAQEDAEEFLSSVLNGIHEEMIGLGEVLNTGHDTQNGLGKDMEESNEDLSNDDDLWREVGSKNRSLPIRTAKVVNTPIQEIFGGSLFSIRTAGKDRCGHRSPFFDLQLDISSDNVRSVQDAIKSFTATEVIQDFYCSKTKQKLDAQRKTSLDQLPPILILHLKQFVYTQDQGLKKLVKKIDYPIDFELPESCLYEKNFGDKKIPASRSYKLLAVVYHDGKEAIKGHYLTDVYHIGSSQWIRCDDSNLKVVSSPRIENLESARTPYLLFYRRLNTLRVQPVNHDPKKKI